MVLQNKFKARASARYNATRGGSEGGGRGRGRGSGQPGRGSRGRGRGRGGGWIGNEGSVGRDGDGEDSDEDEDEDEEEEDSADAAFPTLQASAQAGPSRKAEKSDAEQVPAKYARRKLESNAWRYKDNEADSDPDAEPEPEVDLTNLFARVAKLDSSKNAIITLGAPQAQDPSGDVETAEELETDIDHSLAYLYERERARERARTGRARELEQRQQGLSGSGGSNVIDVASMSAEDRKKLEEEAEEMKADKEKADALRALKERFQGHAVGERVKTSTVRRLISSQPSASDNSTKDRGPKPAHLQPKRERLPEHARSWASRQTEEGTQDVKDDFFFDEVGGTSSSLTRAGPEVAAEVAKTGASTSTQRKSAPAQTDAKEMEDFLDAMLG
ncbi:hypothetical protein CF327_g4444 [Tilletia walkeri]|nr:hypothetical protein CF327_g4444 [Tilletia walkeri]